MNDQKKQRNNLFVLMALAFLIGLSVIPVVLFVARFISSIPTMSLEDAFATQRLQLTDKVWLLATGGTDVMLADEHDMGLVYGNVVMAGHPGGDKQTLLVLYASHGHDQNSGADLLGALKAAEVDLATAQVSDNHAVTHRELTELRGVFDFMDSQ